MSDKSSGEIIIYSRGDGSSSLEVRLDGETVWLTQAQMADLFQTTPQNITLHLKAIFAEGELDEAATCKDHLQVRQEGIRQVSRQLRYMKYRSQRDALPSEAEAAYLETVKQAQRKVEGKKEP